MTFCCAEEPLCHLWLQTLRELLEKLSAWREARSPGARVGPCDRGCFPALCTPSRNQVHC